MAFSSFKMDSSGLRTKNGKLLKNSLSFFSELAFFAPIHDFFQIRVLSAVLCKEPFKVWKRAVILFGTIFNGYFFKI